MNPSVPADDDPRWVSGDSTSIDPDRKTMVYAKAVNSDGKIARASSTYYVIADETSPQITFDKSYENWNKDNTLTATVTDNLSGVDNATIETRIDHSDKGDVDVKGSTLNFRSLPDGSYKLQVSAKDNSGNEANEIITVKIDTTAPNVNGVKDQSVYHQYYLPRYISVEDKHSGIAVAQITKDGGSAETITDLKKVTEIGTYKIDVKDQAGNEDTINFQIVPLPDIETEIDCSEESRKIVEQIEQEYAESRDHMDETERNNIQKWLDDAHDIRNTCRIKIVYNEDKSAWVEGIGDVDFAMDVVLVVEDIAITSLPSLPSKARMAYNVYLKQGDHEIEPSGMVKVHLPYNESLQEPILYEINDAQEVKEITAQQNESHLIFEVDTLLKYAIAQKEGNKGTNIDIDDDGCPDLNIVMTDEKGNTIMINEDKNEDGIPDYNIDSDGDGKADLNIDTDNDGKPDLNLVILKEWKTSKCVEINGVKYSSGIKAKAKINIDLDGDKLPDIDIDNKGDFKPHLNISKDGKTAAVNIIKLHEWKPNKDYQSGTFRYDSIGNGKHDPRPELNIDSDDDGLADINIDLDHDGKADINIDLDGDLIPDIDIDSNGDGKGDVNVDTDGDGKADQNIIKINKWKPEHNVEGEIPYDTMTLEAIKEQENSGEIQKDANTENKDDDFNIIGGALTGDTTNIMMYMGMSWMAGGILLYLLYKRKMKEE